MITRTRTKTALTLSTMAIATLALTATSVTAALLQVDIQASGATTQGGWDAWNFSTSSSSSAISTTFAYADATDGTVDVSIDPLFSAQGRNYGLSNITDPGNLIIPNVWADQYFWNNNVNGTGTLTLDDLKAGTYTFTSYSGYANNLSDGGTNDEGTASVSVDTGSGFVDTTLDVTFISGLLSNVVPGGTIEAAELITFGSISFQFTVENDNDTVSILYDNLTGGDTFGLNGFELFTADNEPAAAVPEPATVLIGALGLLGMGWLRWRRRKRA